MTPLALSDDLSATDFGGKAAQLSRAVRAGLPVPKGMALPFLLCRRVRDEDPAAQKNVAEVFEQLDGNVLAVRSSHVQEDSEKSSSAGQYLSVLGVRTADELVDAVKRIYESAFSREAIAYHLRMGANRPPGHMGVIVQTIVAADKGGVLFTRNPISHKDERVIEASWGLGATVADGRVEPDRFRLSRDGTVLELIGGVKDFIVTLDENGALKEAELTGARRTELCLNQEELAQLNDLATKCEAVFGPDRDIEWAFSSSGLHLLQCRPITKVKK